MVHPPHTEPTVRLALVGVLVLTGVFYLSALGRAPVNIGSDEARFGIQAQSLAATGRDINGNRLPLFLHITNPLIPNNSSSTWWQPTLFYMQAALLQVVPFSEWSVRLPIACLAILDVWLIYAVGRRLFSHAWFAALAALLLAATPAHLVFGRQAMDYFCPMPFALAWLWCLLAYLQTDASWLPAVTGLVLGVGLYSYITSWVVMPFYLVLTLGIFWRARKPARASLHVIAGCAAALLPLIPWFWLYPGFLRELVGDYKVVSSFNLAQRVSLYWDYFNPSFLFFAGGSNPMWATTKAGVFLLAVAVLLPCGIWSIWKRSYPIVGSVLLVGFFFAPAPIVAALPTNPEYATARDLLALPFGVLISVAGLEWMWTRRSRFARALAVLLVVAIPAQFAYFARDYFTDYQMRSAYRFDTMHFRAVAEYVIASDALRRVPAVYLSDDLGDDKSVQWKFHLLTHGRPDVWDRTKYFAVAQFGSTDIPAGSLLVLSSSNLHLDDLLGPGKCSVVKTIDEVAGGPVAVILRRN